MNTDKIILPCDVVVAPRTLIRAGCTMTTLLKAIQAREQTGVTNKSIDVDMLRFEPRIVEAPKPDGVAR